MVAAGLYLMVGSPTTPDQPFAKRIAEWRDADPTTLSPPQMAALLSLAVAKFPKDPSPLYDLARAQAASGDLPSAEHSLRKAIEIDPKRTEFWTSLGVLLAAGPNGDNATDTVDAFRHALALDPANPDARYYLARARIASGDIAGGLADWKALIAALKPGDPRIEVVNQEMAVVERTHALPTGEEAGDSGPAGAATGSQQQAFIHAMVDRLAAKLQSQPDDPAGWARLIRSYSVLGDKTREGEAMAKAQTLFKNRPADLGTINAAASAPQ